MNIHIALRQIRELKGISQDRLSDLAGLDRTFISLIERGKRKPSLESIDKISHVLGIKTWEILRYICETDCANPLTFKFSDNSSL